MENREEESSLCSWKQLYMGVYNHTKNSIISLRRTNKNEGISLICNLMIISNNLAMLYRKVYKGTLRYK